MVAVPNKIGYFDCFSGISGDMCLGALVDAGVPMEKLKKEMKKIPIEGYEIHAKKVKRAGFSSIKVDIVQSSKLNVQGSKKWKDIKKSSEPPHFLRR
jgi:uncharacterized protein (DUF111 family)